MVLGITGGIATGKSLVAEEFRRLGIPVVNADQLAREAVAPGSEVLRRLARRFGSGILRPDGSLDREKLGRIVFADAAARADLEAITHPAIARLAEQRLEELRERGARLIAYEAPLLFEAGAEKRVDAVLVVAAEPRLQLQRLMEREKIDEEEARRRIDAQMPLKEKLSRADFVIDNSGDREATRQAVRQIFADLMGRAPRPDRCD